MYLVCVLGISHCPFHDVLDKWSFDIWTSQKCKYLFINLRFREKKLTWKEIPKPSHDLDLDMYSIGPSFFPTDYGACCTLVPHLDFEPLNGSQKLGEIYHGLKSDSKNGEINGLDVVLNAEQFNYGAYHQANAAGFKIALHHHSDKPLIKFSSDLGG